MIYYAIRQKSTGFYLPSGRGKGFTHDIPTSLVEKPPRLFIKECAAKVALKCWLKGEWRVVSSSSYDPFNEGDYDYYPEPPDNPPEDRKAEDMEVEKLELLTYNDAR